MENVNLVTVFITGLLTGGLTCMAVQGGLLAATIAQRTEESLQKDTVKTGNALPILAFLFAKITAYTLFGFLLGSLGSFLVISLKAQIVLQLFVVIFMIGTALNILNIHPIFRYFIIQPPRFLTRFIRKQSKRKDLFAPAFLGALTVFIPCGTTQAMMVLAVGTSNPVMGALIMFAFTFGTSPVFFALGYFTAKMGDLLHEKFMKIAAAAIIILALYNLNNTLSLAGSRYTFGNILNAFNCAITFCSVDKELAVKLDPVEEITIEMSDAGYSPNVFAVRRNSTVTMNMVNKEGRGCIQAFTIPSLGIQKVIPVGTTERITFKVPDQPGNLEFTCSMGMYPGTIKVI